MVLEIERKFILRDLSALASLNYEGVSVARNEITQIYTQITPVSEVRFRKINDKFFAARKSGRGLVREEQENETTEEIFNDALRRAVAIPIKKSRFLFKINNLPCNIDFFSEALEGLITLEIEFLTTKDAKNFIIPDFIKNSILAEITEDERYKNKNLALYGLPRTDFNIVKTFELLSANANIKLTFPGTIRSIDALRVVFFQIYKTLTANISEFEVQNKTLILHKIRVNLRKMRSLLELFSPVFNQKVADYFLSSFKNIANATNPKRDIDVFYEFLKTQKHSRELIKIVKKLDENETRKVKIILENTKNSELLRDWEVFIKEQSDFYKGEKFDEIIKKTVAKTMRLQIIKIKKMLLSLNDESPNTCFHDMRKQIKKFRYLTDIFIDLFAVKSIEKCAKKTKEMQKILGILQDTDVWLEFLKRMQGRDETLKIKTKIQKIALKNRGKILEKKIEYVKSLCKLSRILKIYYV